MSYKLELLAPGGDIDAIKAAIAAGANAIYCGLDRFNARNSATNICFDDLLGILKLAHKNNCKVFLTLNIIIFENEIPDIFVLLNKLVNTSIDGIIVQDLGLFYILSNYFNSLKIHASTQCTTHNDGQIEFLSMLGVERVNLSRELNIDEIKSLTLFGKQKNISTEVFVHGSNCICFSGICYMSNFICSNSGNRGRCSQPCRDNYLTTPIGKDYPLNLKDNSAFFDLKELADVGVASLKIEGRIKKYDYVYTVVNAWAKQIKQLYNENTTSKDNSELYKVFNRDFSNAFLKGNISNDMFIDNPRDHSIAHLSQINTFENTEDLELAQLKLYKEKETIKSNVEAIISKLSIAKTPIKISLSGEVGLPLNIYINTPESSFEIVSESNLLAPETETLNRTTLLKRLKAINDTEYYIEELNLHHLKGKTYLPFKELNSIKKKILFFLNNNKEFIEAIEVPQLNKSLKNENTPTLSVIISSINEITSCKSGSEKVFFQLPSSFQKIFDEFIAVFNQNKHLIPLFPSIIIGKDYITAIKFIDKLKPSLIATNNTGIAFEAYKRNIDWIAGPQLNLANSYSLKCLNDIFNCKGGFFSEEVSKSQITKINIPSYFTIYQCQLQNIPLMTSRQCLFQQVAGCEKPKMDDSCIAECEKIASITNLKKQTFIISKTKGNYCEVNRVHKVESF
ncbi:MAG: U32 family peptidase [Bacteroidota bacterium]